jgi:phage terminase large subunit-like protein
VSLKPIKTLDRFDPEIPTLGWGVIEFIETWLIQPDGDHAGEPFKLTREQKNFVLWFYAVAADGRWRFRRAVLRRAKGWGKSPFLGALCLAELVGPVVFDGWDSNGDPLGRSHASPWVVIAGVSETQTANTLDAIRAMISSEFADAFGLDVGITRIYVAGGGKLVPITTNPATQEGARPTFAVMDEVHHWTLGNGGKNLAKVIRRNLAKVRGRSIVTTNAHNPAQDTVGRDYFDAHLAQVEGRTRRADLLYDSTEAPALTDEDFANEDTLRAALKCAYGDATWVEYDDLISEIYSPDTPIEDSCRFYLNQIVDAADAWATAGEWDANALADLAPLACAKPGQWRKGDTVTLGFDGGRTDDSTALVAVRLRDGAPFILGLWERPDGAAGEGWEVNREAVRGAVDNAFATLDVVAFFADVAEWETDVDDWRDRYGERLFHKATTKHAVAWDMRAHQADTVRATEALHRAITDKAVPHDGDPRLRRHVLNARRRPGRWGISFGKESRESKHKVDALAAMLLARMAATFVTGTNALARRGGVGTLVGYGRRNPALAAQQAAKYAAALAAHQAAAEARKAAEEDPETARYRRMADAARAAKPS